MSDPTWTDVGTLAVAVLALLVTGIAVYYSRGQVKHAARAVEEAQAQTEHAAVAAEQARAQSDYAARQLELAQRLREDQVQPYLLVELDLSLREAQLLVVRVTNAGMTAARDVRATIEPAVTTHDGEIIDVVTISTLAPGGVWERAIDSAPSYFENDLPRQFTVAVEGIGPFGRVEPEPYAIDLDQLAPKLAIDSEGVLIAKALKKAAGHLGSLDQAATWWKLRELQRDRNETVESG